MIDDELNPWLLEVNLSPSLTADSPLDHRIKANLIADLFNLSGVANIDQSQQGLQQQSSLLKSQIDNFYPGIKSNPERGKTINIASSTYGENQTTFLDKKKGAKTRPKITVSSRQTTLSSISAHLTSVNPSRVDGE